MLIGDNACVVIEHRRPRPIDESVVGRRVPAEVIAVELWAAQIGADARRHLVRDALTVIREHRRHQPHVRLAEERCKWLAVVVTPAYTAGLVAAWLRDLAGAGLRTGCLTATLMRRDTDAT